MEPGANNEKAEKKVLRAQDIIPSSEGVTAKMVETAVPQFDLATEIMAQQRKKTASRRKRPESKVQTGQEEIQVKPSNTIAETAVFHTPVQDAIIAEIVQRDIQRMLQTQSGSQA